MNTPPGTDPPSTTHPTAPTLGAVIGAAIGTALVTVTGLEKQPVLAGALVTGVVGLFTSVFHWIGTKAGYKSW